MIEITDNIKYNFSSYRRENIVLSTGQLGSFLLDKQYSSKYCFYYVRNNIIEINSFNIDSNNINLYIKYKIA